LLTKEKDINILLIDPNGNNLGQHTMETAERVAEDYGLDLVEVRPGVYKILDLGKLNYEASKRKQIKQKSVKDMKFKLNIGENDYNTKIGHVRKFLSSGHTVRITIWFSGREVTRPEVGLELMKRIATSIEDLGSVTMDGELQGKNMNMSVIPGNRKQ
jgi:translation initiation factor IF-3